MKNKVYPVTNDCIYDIERNIHGAWVIYGEIGTKQYIGYTKAKAKYMYMKEVEKHNWLQSTVNYEPLEE